MRISLGKGSTVVTVALTVLAAAAGALGLSRWAWGALGIAAIVALFVTIASHPKLVARIPLLGRLPFYAEWEERKRIVEQTLIRERYDADRLSSRETVHPDGQKDTEVFLTAAVVAVSALDATVTKTVAPPLTRCERLKRRLRRGTI